MSLVSIKLSALALVSLAGAAIFVVAKPAAADDARSPFAGSYQGEFTFKSAHPLFGNSEGTFTLKVSPTGTITGRFKNTTIEKTAEVKGSVDADGEIAYSMEFDNQSYLAK